MSSWKVATYEACLREANYLTGHFSFSGLCMNQLDTVVHDTQSKSRTPKRTMHRAICQLTEEEYIARIKSGVWELVPNNER